MVDKIDIYISSPRGKEQKLAAAKVRSRILEAQQAGIQSHQRQEIMDRLVRMDNIRAKFRDGVPVPLLANIAAGEKELTEHDKKIVLVKMDVMSARTLPTQPDTGP